MKKLFMIAMMAMAALTVSAQDKKMAVGVNVNYGMESGFKQFGFGAKFQYEFIENFRGEVSGDYFLKKDGITIWDANLNFHYLIPLSDNLKVYPLLGLSVIGSKVNVDIMDEDKGEEQFGTTAEYNQYKEGADGASSSSTNFGFNAGAGIEYYLSESFKLNFEAKYAYGKDWKWPVISIGAAYCF